MQKKFKLHTFIFLTLLMVSSCSVDKKNSQKEHESTTGDLCLWESVSYLGEGNSTRNNAPISLCNKRKNKDEKASLLLFPPQLKVSSNEKGLVELIFNVSPSLLKKKQFVSEHTEKEAWRLHYTLKVDSGAKQYLLIDDQVSYKKIENEFSVSLDYGQFSHIAHAEKSNQLRILFDIWQEAGKKKSKKHQQGSFIVQFDSADLAKYSDKENLNDPHNKQKDASEKEPETKRDNESQEKEKSEHDHAAEQKDEEEPSLNEGPLATKPQAEEEQKDEPEQGEVGPHEQTPEDENEKQEAVKPQEEGSEKEPTAETQAEEEKEQALNENDLAAKRDEEKAKDAEKKAARKAEKRKRQERTQAARTWLKDQVKDSEQNLKDIKEYQKKSAQQEAPYQTYVKMNEEKINSMNKEDALGIKILSESINRTRSGLVGEYKKLGKYLTTSEGVYKDLDEKKDYLNEKKVLKFRNKLLEMDKVLNEEREKIVKKVRNLNKQTAMLKKLQNGNSIEARS